MEPHNGIAEFLSWQIGVGNVVVVRQDCKPLLIPHLECLIAFNKHIMSRMDDMGIVQLTQTQQKQWYNKEVFRAWCSKNCKDSDVQLMFD